MSILTKILGDPNKKVLKDFFGLAAKINELEPEVSKWEHKQFLTKTQEIKDALKQGKALDDFLFLAFAMVREAAKRTIGQRHFDVQLLGGIALHRGQIAEMKTGEGKTLTATLPVYLNSLEGKGVHMVTVNDYLARRDTVWMGKVYHYLGISVSCIQHMQAFMYDPDYKAKEQAIEESGDSADSRKSYMVDNDFLRPVSRREAYQADVLYGTNNEFGFDYLRDNMVMDLMEMSQRGHHYAIVDEVDSILIDEARTPLIISAPAEESTDKYYKFADLVKRLEENKDFNIDEKMRAATLTEEGIAKMEKWLGVDNIYTSGGIREVQHIENALKAQTLFKLDRDYVVKEGEVIIVDEFTGRMLPGRRYSEGLHQAIEAKEGVQIQRESITLATITLQNYFRMYKKLAGMTGTAATEAEEFAKIYNLDVTVMPTNKPMVRKDQPDAIFKSEKGKFQAIVNEIKRRNELGQPLLVGTISIEKNERLGALLEREGIPYQLLNAKQHEKEAQILAQAGKKGAVTIATNMAGRGVDIILGGNPPQPEEQEEVKKAGGLHVMGTERHESRRIDNQLRGRSGRQGDPGSSQFFISMEDDLMRIFGGERMIGLMNTLRVPEDMPIENSLISRSIEKAQQKVELHNFDIRKNLVEYDDVINKQREVIYKKRRDIIEIAEEELNQATLSSSEGKSEPKITLKEMIFEMLANELTRTVQFHTASENRNEWNIKEIYEVTNTIFPVSGDLRLEAQGLREKLKIANDDEEFRKGLVDYLIGLAQQQYDLVKEKMIKDTGSAIVLKGVEKGVLLRSIDNVWIDHLEAMDHLRSGIGLRGYGQRDPLQEYKRESYKMFNELLIFIEKQTVYSFFKVTQIGNLAPDIVQQRNIQFSAPSKEQQAGFSGFYKDQPPPSEPKIKLKPGAVAEENIKLQARDKSGNKIGRNDPCPCGSGKKYKKCGLINTDEHQRLMREK